MCQTRDSVALQREMEIISTCIMQVYLHSIHMYMYVYNISGLKKELLCKRRMKVKNIWFEEQQLSTHTHTHTHTHSPLCKRW